MRLEKKKGENIEMRQRKCQRIDSINFRWLNVLRGFRAKRGNSMGIEEIWSSLAG